MTTRTISSSALLTLQRGQWSSLKDIYAWLLIMTTMISTTRVGVLYWTDAWHSILSCWETCRGNLRSDRYLQMIHEWLAEVGGCIRCCYGLCPLEWKPCGWLGVVEIFLPPYHLSPSTSTVQRSLRSSSSRIPKTPRGLDQRSPNMLGFQDTDGDNLRKGVENLVQSRIEKYVNFESLTEQFARLFREHGVFRSF